MFIISVPLILSAFGIIFIAEIPDKTALAALVLATRYRARDVILGAMLALALQTVIAVTAGSFLNLLPALPVRVAAGLGFLVFSFLAFYRNEEEAEQEEEQEVLRAKPLRPLWLTSFLIIFAAELGDLTQFATAALVARDGHPLSIGIGAMLALWAVVILAVTAGSRLNRYLDPDRLKLVSGALFAIVGVLTIASAFV